MMKPEPMSKVTIIGPKHYQEKVINTMYDLNAYHIKEHRKTDKLDIGRPSARAEKLAEVLVKIRGVMSALNITENNVPIAHVKTLTEKDVFELGRKSKMLYAEVTSIIERVKQIEEQQAQRSNQIEMLHVLDALQLSLDLLKQSSTLVYAIGTVAGKPRQFQEEMQKCTPHFSLIIKEIEKIPHIALFYPHATKEPITPPLQH